MKKVVIRKPGSYEKLEIQECADLNPLPDEIIISTRVAGINFADCCVRMGVYASAKKYVDWPITPGFEVSGIVDLIGENVKGFSKGDKVVAITRFNGYATQLAVPESQVFPLPESLSFEEGAAVPAVFLTAYYAMHELVYPKKNSKMLVHSAAGGVGSALVQLGKIANCEITGVVGSTHKIEFLKSLGVESIIDKSTQDLWKEVKKIAPDGFDAVYDANGPETLMQSYHHLSPGGKLVVYGFHTMLTKGRGTPNWLKVIKDYLMTPKFNPLNMTGDNHSVLAFNLSYLFDQQHLMNDALKMILKWFKEGKLSPPPLTTYSFNEVQNAHRALESGQTVGKLLLRID